MQDYHLEKDIEESQQDSGEQEAGAKIVSRAPTGVKLGNHFGQSPATARKVIRKAFGQSPATARKVIRKANTACNKRKKNGTTTKATQNWKKWQTASAVAPTVANCWW
jgi:hypothetical protein